MYILSTDDISVAMAVDENDRAWGVRRFWVVATVIAPLLLLFTGWFAIALSALVVCLLFTWRAHLTLLKTRVKLEDVVNRRAAQGY